MSHHLTSQDRMSPTSLNYVSANAATHGQRLPRYDSMTTESIVGSSPSKRVQFRAKAKKIGTSVTKGLKTFVAFCHRGTRSDSSDSSFKIVHRTTSRLSMHLAQPTRASTPSIFLTHPTYRGSNVRLSVHQVPPSRGYDQGFEDVDGPPVGGKRKSTPLRFNHPVVSGIIADDAISIPASVDSWEDRYTATRPGTGTTVATLDFENQVNPKRVHKLRASASYKTFLNDMDGARPNKPAPQAAADQAGPAPKLPYVPLSSTMGLEGDNASTDTTDLASLAAQLQAEYVLPATSKLPAVLMVAPPHRTPTVLTPGNAQPAIPKPRTTALRPHTTGNFLPYISFDSNFDPYKTGPTTNTNTSATAATPESKGKGKAKAQLNHQTSSTSLSAAFAEAEENERRLAHKRHTVLYEAVENDFALAPVPTAAPPQPRIKRKAVPAPLPAAPKRAAAARTSKPLPPTPSPTSPRRFTQFAAAPEKLRMNENGYPLIGKKGAEVSGREKEKSKKVRRTRTVRAVEAALEKFLL
ncbi:hypothetical protein Q7P37_004180 [Cladosporium fusiforme]